MTVKMVITALGLAAFIATPAFAQKQKPRQAAPVASTTMATSADGRVIGTDPDARVRFELQRDWEIYTGNN